MIIGIHALLYSADADKDRAFISDVLGFKGLDSGGGWMIYKLPPAELGVHPVEGKPFEELYLMCDSITSTLEELRSKGVECSEPTDEGWGVLSNMILPSGRTLGIYEPRHGLAINL